MATTPSRSTAPLERPLADLAAWTRHLHTAEIPVLAETARALEAMRSNEDRVDANALGELIANDPLMTLKVFAYAAAHRSSRVITDTETVTATLVMMGISPFFRAFGPQPTVEDHLAGAPQALEGLEATLRRSHRAANFALGFAVHHMDHDAPVIHAATLLHDFAELLIWVHAPALALQIQAVQRADLALRSSKAQRQVLNIELADLQQSLMRAWRLPELLIRISDDRHADQPNVKSVSLAIRLARHTADGWDNPAIPDDIEEIAGLLNLSPAATLELVRGI
jgi:HD-like signal output (HDOD) protein